MDKRKVVIILSLLILITISIYIFTTRMIDKNTADEGENIENEGTSSLETDQETQKAPDFVLENLNGEKISLNQFKGKVVLVNFWTTWCPYCVMEMPDLDKFYIENKDKDFVILAINIGEPKSEIKNFIDEKGYTFPVLMDKDGTVAGLYGVVGIPTSFLIDEKGTIRMAKPEMITYEEIRRMVNLVKGDS